MIESTDIKFIAIDENHMLLKLNDLDSGVKVAGRHFEAQYEIGEFYLVILTADEAALTLVLLNLDGKIVDQEFIGHWFFDSYFENPRVVSKNTLEFEFGTKGIVCIECPPVKSVKCGKVRYLQIEGFPIYA